MTGNAPHEAHPPRLYVKRWLKLMMYGVCLVPILVMIVSVLREANAPTGNVPLAVVSSLLVCVPFGWLFARIYSLCSIVVSDEGVAQSFTLPRTGLRKHVYLRWHEVQHVSFSRFSFYFAGDNNVKLELNTALFSDVETTIRAVRERLPARLLSQLD